jgi:carbon storage regulator
MVQVSARNAYQRMMDKPKRPKRLLSATLLFPSLRLPARLAIGTRRAFPSPSPAPQPFTEVSVMLVLTRKVGEKVIIDGCITVTVVAVDGNKVRIGITAPPEVRIDREEIHRQRMEFAEVEETAEELVPV